jgi:hypothetical protein
MDLKRIYIAGPMRGIPHFNFPAFDAAAVRFRAAGFAVINPADIDRDSDGPTTTPEQAEERVRTYAERDTQALLTCTHIALLPGWETSTGAMAEYHFAKWIKLTILCAISGQPLEVKSVATAARKLDGFHAKPAIAATATHNPPNPKDRIGKTKPPLHLVPSSSIIFEALAMGDGAEKYEPFNWRETAVEAMTYIGACKRHVEAWVDREELASDSLVHHLGHAKACLGIILDAMVNDKLIDNRPPKGRAAALLAQYTKHVN